MENFSTVISFENVTQFHYHIFLSMFLNNAKHCALFSELRMLVLYLWKFSIVLELITNKIFHALKNADQTFIISNFLIFIFLIGIY